MTQRNEAIHSQLHNSLKGVAEGLADILNVKQSETANISKVMDAAGEIFSIVRSEFLDLTKPDGRQWTSYVSIARTLDRALALISTVDAEQRATDAYSAFSGLICDGEHLSSVLNRALADFMKGSSYRYRLNFSAGLIETTMAGSIRYTLPYTAPRSARRRLLAGAASDVVDLLEDLEAASNLPRVRPHTVAVDWQQACRALGLTLQLRANWTCGQLLTADDFGQLIGQSKDQVKELHSLKKVIGLSMWDLSEIVYPVVQVGSNGKVLRHLDSVLSSITPSWPLWHLAIWLGTDHPHGMSYASKLEDDAGLQDVLASLEEFSKLAPGVYQHRSTMRIPTTTELGGAYEDGLRTRIPGSPRKNVASRPTPDSPDRPTSYEWTGPEVEGISSRLFRITRAGFGPFFYSNAKLANSGRFDLSTDGFGTCYTSMSREGAISEVFDRVPVLSIQEVASRTIWEMIPLEGVYWLLDLTDDGVTNRLHVRHEISDSRERRSTQAFADRTKDAHYAGVIHTLRSRIADDSKGVALFGKAGPQSGGGVWHVQPMSLLECPEFWQWLEEDEIIEAREFLSQLPNG